MENNARSTSFSVFSGIEKVCVQGIDSLSNVAISALDQSHEVLDHAEKMASRLLKMKNRLDKVSEEQQVVLKKQLLTLCHDAVDVGNEAAQGAFKILQQVISESQELQKNGDQLWQDIRPELNLNNPFRQKTAAKPSTIIPISIQDN